MKMSIIGAVLLVIVLAVLYVVTGGLKSSNTEQEVNGQPEAVVVEPAPADAQPTGNKNFNL
jgi:hypothetical protein